MSSAQNHEIESSLGGLGVHPGLQVVLQVGSTVFVHAGVLPEHARYGLERMNTCVPCSCFYAG